MDDVAHRPWPVPDAPWAQAQSWVDMAFLHWRVERARAAAARARLGRAADVRRLGVARDHAVPAQRIAPARAAAAAGRLDVPGAERPHLRHARRQARRLVLLARSGEHARGRGAKRLYKLPYHRAQMRYERDDDYVHHESARAGAAFSASYRGAGDLFHAEPGSLEEFLIERYCLYTEDGGRAYRAELHHPPLGAAARRARSTSTRWRRCRSPRRAARALLAAPGRRHLAARRA